MCGDEYALITLYSIYRQLLERIERKLVLARRFRGRDMLCDRNIGIAGWDSNLVLDLSVVALLNVSLRMCSFKYVPSALIPNAVDHLPLPHCL